MSTGPHISIITLNGNGLNAPTKDKDWVNGYKNKTLCMLSTRDPPQNKGHLQTEREGLEKDISYKWRLKKSRSSNTHII